VHGFRVALVVAGVALAIVAEASRLDENRLGATVADGIVGAVLLVCGVVAWERVTASRTGPLMMLAGLAWFAGTWWSVGLFWHRGPLVHLHLSYPTGRLRRRLAAATVAVAYVNALVEPVARNDVVTLGLAALVALAAVDVFAKSSGRARRADVPALGAAVAYSGVLAVGAAARLAGWDLDEAMLYLYDAVVATVVLVLFFDLLWGRWSEAAVADLVVGLGERGGLGTLRDQLARALGDPSLNVGYWMAEQAAYVDDLGRPLDLPGPGERRSITTIDDGGQRVAVLVHDATTIDDPRLVASVAAAARLAVVNARLQAEARSRVIELAASRRRVVESGDEQRHRLERELAEGPEHHLDEVLRLLDEARHQAQGTVAAELINLGDELRTARGELHDVVQGIRPPALGEGGLAAALPVLAGRSRVPVRLSVEVGRLPPAVEAAVYFVCAEALANVAKHAQATVVSVAVFSGGSAVVARVEDDGTGGVDPTHGSGLRGLADRVEALGGRFRAVAGTRGGSVVQAEIPVDDAGPTGIRVAGVAPSDGASADAVAGP
jgi:signal transduction histidine kinase